MDRKYKIGVIGLGYVGLPLACMFAGRYRVVGFDTNRRRVDEISRGTDRNGDIDRDKLKEAISGGLRCTADPAGLRGCNVYIVAVPTPVDELHHPDLSPLARASRTVGSVLSRGDIVIYESTVYPGATEEFCAPILEEVSGLRLNEGFYLGYSPERINPGDREHTVENIRKVTSGSTPEIAAVIDSLYNSVLLNGTYRASSIKVAEASKIIENTQRDVNIAFMNEMAMVLNAIGVSIQDVIEAAGTKWNFQKLSPGLVGGHCIGVDPYYLIEKAKDAGVYPRLTTEARRINESMGRHVAEWIVRSMNQNGLQVKDARILLLGFTFKENCRDIRNTKVVEIYRELRQYTCDVQVFDPMCDPEKVRREYGVDVDSDEKTLRYGTYDVVVHCVKHDIFRHLDVAALCSENGLVFDVKRTAPVRIARPACDEHIINEIIPMFNIN